MNPYQSEQNPDNEHENKCVKNVIHDSPSKHNSQTLKPKMLCCLGSFFLDPGVTPAKGFFLLIWLLVRS